MKRIGYRAEIAGAIEASRVVRRSADAADHGRRAFIMAELTGIPTPKIIVAAALPAILYYAGIMATVHWEALKQGIGTMKADIPPMRSLLRGSLLFTPFFTIVYFLHRGYSPSKAALYSMLTAIVVSWVARDSPMTPPEVFRRAVRRCARASSSPACWPLRADRRLDEPHGSRVVLERDHQPVGGYVIVACSWSSS